MYLIFNGGIYFSCQKCGSCCKYQKGFGVQLLPDDIFRISDYLKQSRAPFITNYCLLAINAFTFKDVSLTIEYIELDLVKDDKSCPFLRQNLCVIHDVKPHICKRGPFISSLLSNKHFWDIHRKKCPGVGQGNYYSKASIQRMCQTDNKIHDFYNEQFKRAGSVWNILSMERVSIPRVIRKYKYDLSYEEVVQGNTDKICTVIEQYKRE